MDHSRFVEMPVPKLRRKKSFCCALQKNRDSTLSLDQICAAFRQMAGAKDLKIGVFAPAFLLWEFVRLVSKIINMQKITPSLWFNNNVEEAVEFYTTVFKDAKVVNMVRYTDAGPGPAGSVMTAVFQLHGQQFIALNGGPQFKFNEAVSFVINCQDQTEVDDYWEKLSGGGEKGRCGWLKDKFGLSWQVVPTALPNLLSGQDGVRTKRVMEALMKMDKIEIDKLEEAYQDLAETA